MIDLNTGQLGLVWRDEGGQYKLLTFDDHWVGDVSPGQFEDCTPTNKAHVVHVKPTTLDDRLYLATVLGYSFFELDQVTEKPAWRVLESIMDTEEKYDAFHRQVRRDAAAELLAGDN